MKKLFILVVLMLSTTLIFSQDSLYPYFPDRPGFTCNTRLNGLQRTDYEVSFGYNSNYLGTGPDVSPVPMCYNTNLIRYGLNKHLELRFGLDFGFVNSKNESPVRSIKGESFGLKIPIVKDLKYLPDIGILGQLNFPNMGNPEYFAYDKLSPQVVLLLQKGLGKFLILGNAGIFYDGFTYDEQGLYSLLVGYNITPQFGTFVETYRLGIYGTYWDLGFNYFINDNLQVDVSYCNQFNGGDFGLPKSYYINGGLAWRLPKK